MPRCRLTFLILLVALCSVCCLFLAGCGRSLDRTAVKRTASPPGASMVSSAKTARQNLSMAKKLNKEPSCEYILGSDDIVEISVFGHDELKMEARISPTGKISYYLTGDIQAAGLTQFQLRDKIQEKLTWFIKNPKVVVGITRYQSHKIFVLGQVKNPGVYRLQGDFSLLEAISSAGGITPDAYLGGAYVVRDGKVLLVNFFELIEKGNTTENIPLIPEDIIYIPDNKDQKVFVLGEVNKQSAVQIRDRLMLLEAIAEAGGFTEDANKKAILVMRGNLSQPEIIKVDANRMDLVANIPLKRGDIVYVASSAFSNVERIALRISHILEPFLDVARGIILTDSAIDILEGGSRAVVTIPVTD